MSSFSTPQSPHLMENDDDETLITGLLGLLEPGLDLSMPSKRSELPDDISLVHFSLNKNGMCNYRDATVLGEHTCIRLPHDMLNSDRLRIGIWLNHEIPLSCSSIVPAPEFVSSRLKATNSEMCGEYPLGKNEVWVCGSELENGLIEFKKRPWSLSFVFRKVTGAHWPKFVITATAYRKSSVGIVSPEESCISKEFEVRSKEQSNRSLAARGFAENARSRRTPETEARASRLREVQAEITELRKDVHVANESKKEYELRFSFIRALTQNWEPGREIYNLVK